MDDWLGNGKLVDLCPVLLPAEDLKKSLASHISLHLPWDQIPLVQSLPLEGEEMDMPRWVGNGSDIFNARLVYKVGLAPPPVDHKCWILVWKFGGSMRFSVHIWQARCYGLKSRMMPI
ncbi:hypothetical protein M9H77_07715 [Catharanthus roseus]|uniref:Uncharacterized protein n=1 Tax=Catharanthus roseus TaxID=4058 RepID=A0ACC0BVS3_CATRO|nr:hypothetical protein M9H77_07715 [Catharanthus roseus]